MMEKTEEMQTQGIIVVHTIFPTITDANVRKVLAVLCFGSRTWKPVDFPLTQRQGCILLPLAKTYEEHEEAYQLVEPVTKHFMGLRFMLATVEMIMRMMIWLRVLHSW
ncbi:hypothetical protein Nepgr_012761 [Nepenthes gracilis]|uniref:Uncharacterized protein n=1 Tax=Nepenthes gracilis TaxID=150966 RepID=A0AAD3XNN2_NEPGR|nr:hypothetical protein Nepgr_012761 [Nepenthes gracilis]